jgi:5-formyltetrahydrofolate cyclo-ligase
MSATEERKTLTMKGKLGTWQTPSKVQEIEDTLIASIKAALNDYIKLQPTAFSYHQDFGNNNTVKQKMLSSISTAYANLLNTVKFRTEAQARETFDIIANKVNKSLEPKLEDHAYKFNEACKDFFQSKQSLPKVADVANNYSRTYRSHK